MQEMLNLQILWSDHPWTSGNPLADCLTLSIVERPASEAKCGVTYFPSRYSWHPVIYTWREELKNTLHRIMATNYSKEQTQILCRLFYHVKNN